MCAPAAPAAGESGLGSEAESALPPPSEEAAAARMPSGSGAGEASGEADLSAASAGAAPVAAVVGQLAYNETNGCLKPTENQGTEWMFLVFHAGWILS